MENNFIRRYIFNGITDLTKFNMKYGTKNLMGLKPCQYNNNFNPLLN